MAVVADLPLNSVWAPAGEVATAALGDLALVSRAGC